MYAKFTPPLSSRNQKPKLCKECKFFKPNTAFFSDSHETIRWGLCTKQGLINLVDGTIEYQVASLTRITDCKGEWWMEIPKTKSSQLS